MKRPNFFIVGAPKAGTTALSDYLRQHPKVFMCKPKEPHYFSDDLPGMRQVVSLNDYLALFRNASDRHAAVGEASVWYLYSSKALANIHAFDPRARVIIMIRNPVDLVYSLHSQMLMSTDENEADFSAAWHIQDERARGMHIPLNCREADLLQYRYTCLQGQQVQRALQVFPREQIHFILFNEFIRDTGEIYTEVCRFLDIDDDAKPSFEIINANKFYRNRRVAEFVERPPDIFGRKILNVKLSHIRKFIRRLNSKTVPRQPMDQVMRNELADYFDDDIRLLGKLIDRDLACWSGKTRA